MPETHFLSDGFISSTKKHLGGRLCVNGVCYGVLAVLISTVPVHAADYPEKPVKVVVPFAPGGGSDTFVRIVQGVVQSEGLLEQRLVVINRPGAGGTIGSQFAKDAEPDGYTILNLHDGILSARHAGQTEYGPEAFEPIAATGRTGSMVCVKAGSRWTSLPQLLKAARDQPNTITFAANLGALSHFAGLKLESAFDGAGFRYVPTGGGAKRFGDLIGEHVEVSVFAVAEYAQFKDGGLQAIAFLDTERHPAFPDVRTAREDDIDVVWDLIQYWWAPKGTPQHRVDRIVKMLRDAMASAAMRKRLEELMIEPLFLSGQPLQRELLKRELIISQVGTGDPIKLPDTPLFVILATVLLGIVATAQCCLPRRPCPDGTHSATDDSPQEVLVGAGPGHIEQKTSLRLPLITAAMLLIFCLLFSLRVAPYWLLSTSFILILGTCLLNHNRRNMSALIAAAVLVGPGCHYLFTEVLVIDI
ncbi:MAG: tripartite tricarboxylate transporter substrate binding protein [Fuerstiella sp.]